ncbi:MAG: CoB--CoM heterodisulfide reductase iron-sulfur subunit B family protein [Candidatus Firestonebacteria bacterium]
MYKVAYFPGCSLHSTAKEYDITTRLICEDLGIELVEIPDWVCCGATTAHITSELTAVALPVKNLIKAEKMKLPITSPCSACFSRLKLADIYLKNDKELKKDITELIGEEYKGEVEILHLSRVIIEKYGLNNLKQKIKKELKGLRVACYYGCLLTRPKEVCDYDKIEDPEFLDNLVTTLGAEPVKWYYKTECCGAAFSLTKKDIVLKLTGNILKEAKDVGADLIIVACPLCQSNLDARQPEIMKKNKSDLNIPVLYWTQLIGLALGYNHLDLMFDKHFINPKKVLQSKGLL